jgi:hypothetical protein
MNRKQFLLIVVAVCIIGGAGLVLFKRNRDSWADHEAKAGAKVLATFAINDVAAIHVQGKSSFDIVQKSGGWCVPQRSDYPANFRQVQDLLLRLADLKVIQSDSAGPSQLGPLCLAAPGSAVGAGTLLELKNNSGVTLRSLLVGVGHMRAESKTDPFRMKGLFDSRYVLIPSDPENVILASDDLAPAASDPGEWLDKTFFQAETIRLVSLISPEPGASWEISRQPESKIWTLSDAKPGEALNQQAAADVGEILAFPTFVDVLPKSFEGKPATSALGHPNVITILADDFAYTLRIGPKRTDGMYCVAVSVMADIPEARESNPDETTEDKEKLDQAFREKTSAVREKLAREQPLASWVFVADSWVEMVNRPRAQMLQQPALAAQQTSATGSKTVRQ